MSIYTVSRYIKSAIVKPFNFNIIFTIFYILNFRETFNPINPFAFLLPASAEIVAERLPVVEVNTGRLV